MISSIARPYWIKKILCAWEKRPLVWLNGVRRVGKTTLAKMLPNATYLNCDLPSVARRLADPEMFFDSLAPDTVLVLDEVHRLEDPSLILKIATDEYPHLRTLATGSSTLAATKKFRDSLTGRKVSIYLPPVLWAECRDIFGVADLDKRLLHGGFPEQLLAERKDASFFAEWIDSYYARDVQELFGIRNRSGFLNLLRLCARNSGGLAEYTNLAQLSDLTRPTVKSHIEALVVADAAFILPPYHGGSRRELTRRPKCYMFDTGLVTFVKGWETIRADDRGLLWEHLVLDTIRTAFDESDLFYWRDKSGREIDFVVRRGHAEVDTIECKIDPTRFDGRSLSVFREAYAQGENYVVSPGVKECYKRKIGSMTVSVCPLDWFLTGRDEAAR